MRADTVFAIPITKVDKGEDGSRIVWGRVTDDTIDLDDQIVDKGFAEKGLQQWFTSFANVRQMHSNNLPPAGKGIELVHQDDGTWLRSQIVEPGAIKLVDANVYQAYSVGIAKPRIVRDSAAKNGRIVDGVFSEVSLVDYPANPNARLSVVKGMVDGTETLFLEADPAPETAAPVTDPATAIHDAIVKAADDGDGDGDTEPDGDDGFAGNKAPPFKKKPKKGKRKAIRALLAKIRGDGEYVIEPDAVKIDVTNEGERAKIPASDFILSGERKFPAPTQKDFNDAISSWGRYKGKTSFEAFKRKAIALARRKGYTLPKEWQAERSAKKAKKRAERAERRLDKITKALEGFAEMFQVPGPVPFAYQAMHDATCAAYSWDDVVEAHKGTFDDWTPAMVQAHKDLHDAFLDANADAVKAYSEGAGPALPRPGGQPSPGSFKRPYLSAGHARESGGQSARIPSAGGMNAGQFGRGYLTGGHARENATKGRDGINPGDSGRAIYDAAAAAQNQAMQIALHDRLCSAWPQICAMGTDGVPHGSTTVIDMGGHGPQSTSLHAASPVIVKDGRATVVDADGTVRKFVTAKASRDAARAAAKRAKKKATEKVAQRLADADVIEKKYKALAAEPDPNKAPYRGTAAATSQEASQKALVDKTTATAEAEREERKAYLASIVKRHPDPGRREAAYGVLVDEFGPEVDIEKY